MDAVSVLLHGDLQLLVMEARHLPNMDLFSDHLRRLFTGCCASPVRSTDRSGDGHHHSPNIITSDPYVNVRLAGATVARTAVISNDQNPRFNEHFKIPLAHRTPHIEFQVKDNDVLGAQLIGTATVPARHLLSGDVVQNWFPIISPSGSPPKPECALLVSMRFIAVDVNPIYRHGIAADPEKLGVRDTYFPVRKKGMVTLYQDAHVREGEVQQIELEGGRVFENGKCWEDMCHAILEAHHLIYIVGWSIYDKVRLVRESTRPLPEGVPPTLGELLKYKSQEGVRVCLLVWDDKTSSNSLVLRTGGVMQTHDEETRRFFKGSSVICILSPRYGCSKLSIFKQKVVGTLYTHHQKCVLVDTPAPHNNRTITAFIGGLDLSNGRYDTPQHRLFRDLNTVFQNDVHNPTFPEGAKGPRQPWHDLHCKIEGLAAYDVLKNFEQRWQMATEFSVFKQGYKGVPHWHDDALIKLDRILWILRPSDTFQHDDLSLQASKEDTENWHVQIFRSIDSGSVKGFPKPVHEASAKNLVCGKNLVIDKSIHTAYVKAIRSAQHFIYIENQYFIGSSYGWPSYTTAEADNLIPMELALKIASKIRARERFAVYIIIPMWPEGVPTSVPTQEILFWQALSQKFRRFMIYVHAKGMIVDDEYVIMGSANINQRSLDGSRDTEIAMGSYQPYHTWAEKKKHPVGQVYGYRMSLWAEHLGASDPLFKEPESLDCVRLVNRTAEENWTRYTAEDVIPLKGHLLRYPLKVGPDGTVGTVPLHDTFPDVGGKVLGEHSTSLPDNLTM